MPDIEDIIEKYIYCAYILLLAWTFLRWTGDRHPYRYRCQSGIALAITGSHGRGFIRKVVPGVRRKIGRYGPVPVLLSPAIR